MTINLKTIYKGLNKKNHKMVVIYNSIAFIKFYLFSVIIARRPNGHGTWGLFKAGLA